MTALFGYLNVGALVLEDGVDFVIRQPPSSFDLVFADAVRGKFEGLDETLAVVKPGGFTVIDDLLPQPNWPEGHAEKVPLLIERLAIHEQFHMAPMAWASGIVVAVKNPEPVPCFVFRRPTLATESH